MPNPGPNPPSAKEVLYELKLPDLDDHHQDLVFDMEKAGKEGSGPLSESEEAAEDHDQEVVSPQEQLIQRQRRAQKQLQYALETGHSEQLAEVVEEYGELMTVDPEQVEPYIVLGYLACEFGQFESAQRLLETAIRLEPFNQQAQRLIREVSNRATQKQA